MNEYAVMQVNKYFNEVYHTRTKKVSKLFCLIKFTNIVRLRLRNQMIQVMRLKLATLVENHTGWIESESEVNEKGGGSFCYWNLRDWLKQMTVV